LAPVPVTNASTAGEVTEADITALSDTTVIPQSTKIARRRPTRRVRLPCYRAYSHKPARPARTVSGRFGLVLGVDTQPSPHPHPRAPANN
jgi:hypothetical protein